jgi:hypothetical protein
MEQMTREEKKALEAKRVATKVQRAVFNGIRFTFPTKAVKGELDFTKALRRGLKDEASASS